MQELLAEFDFEFGKDQIDQIKQIATAQGNGATPDSVLDHIITEKAWGNASHLDRSLPNMKAKIVGKRRREGNLGDGGGPDGLGTRVLKSVVAKVQIWGPQPTAKIRERIEYLEREAEELREVLRGRGESA